LNSLEFGWKTLGLLPLHVATGSKTIIKPLILLNGGAEGSRTPDLLIANETLYQLSYDPIRVGLESASCRANASNVFSKTRVKSSN
jgi:hypothetical protein